MISARQAAELSRWVDLYAARTDELADRLIAALIPLYRGKDFYSPGEVAAVGEVAEDRVSSTLPLIAGLTAQYVATTVATTVARPVASPSISVPILRGGVALATVYQRPIKLYRRELARQVPRDIAYRRAMNLVRTLTQANVTMARRESARSALVDLQARGLVVGYRRILHPELARSGSCGLCIAASDVKYNAADLMPIHGGCNCTVMPITPSEDPGSSLNGISLGELYARAGNVTAGDALKRTRYVVNTHGEWGPVLGVPGQHFLDPEQIAS